MDYDRQALKVDLPQKKLWLTGWEGEGEKGENVFSGRFYHCYK